VLSEVGLLNFWDLGVSSLLIICCITTHTSFSLNQFGQDASFPLSIGMYLHSLFMYNVLDGIRFSHPPIIHFISSA
jgi:hypothetical protein